MRVIKKGHTGKRERYIHFSCKNCGCEFSMGSDEYWEDLSVSTYPPSHKLYTCCPECHKVCTTIKTNTPRVTFVGVNKDGIITTANGATTSVTTAQNELVTPTSSQEEQQQCTSE